MKRGRGGWDGVSRSKEDSLLSLSVLSLCSPFFFCLTGTAPKKGRDQASDRQKEVGIQCRARGGNAREREMEDKKSEEGRDDRMRKLTEGDGGS